MNRRGVRLFVVGIPLVLVVAGVAWSPTAAMSATFSETRSVSPSGYNAFDVRTAFDRDGDAMAVWVREEQEYPHYRRVQLSRRSHTGTWSSTILVSPSDQDPVAPKIALDDDGDGIVVWRGFDGTEYQVYARRVSKTGTLGPLKVLSQAGVKAFGTDVAIDSDGDAVVTWDEIRDSGNFPMMRRYTKDGSLPAAVTLATSPARAETPSVALDRAGDAVIAWTNDNVVQARTLGSTGTLSALKTVSGDHSPIDRHFTARVAVDRDGNALVVWRHWTQADLSDRLLGRWINRNGVVGSLRELTPSSHSDVVNHSIASDLDGDMWLTWDRFPSKYMYARPLTSTGTVGTYKRLSTHGRLHTVRLDDDGDGAVVYQSGGIDGSASSIRVLTVSRSGTWSGSSQVITENGKNPTVAVSPTGTVMAAWERQYSVDLRVRVSIGS